MAICPTPDELVFSLGTAKNPEFTGNIGWGIASGTNSVREPVIETVKNGWCLAHVVCSEDELRAVQMDLALHKHGAIGPGGAGGAGGGSMNPKRTKGIPFTQHASAGVQQMSADQAKKQRGAAYWERRTKALNGQLEEVRVWATANGIFEAEDIQRKLDQIQKRDEALGGLIVSQRKVLEVEKALHGGLRPND